MKRALFLVVLSCSSCTVDSKKASDIVASLLDLHSKIIAQPTKHTNNSLHQIEAFTEYKEAEQAIDFHMKAGINPIQIIRHDKIKKLKELKGIDPEIIEENQDRLFEQMPNLWLAANPDKSELFSEVKKKWPSIKQRK